MTLVALPRVALVILCGPAGSGKSTFAARHFRPTQVVSSDRCREWITDDERHLASSGDAFEVFHLLIEKRLRWKRLTVADSTAVTSRARADLRRIARRAEVPCVLLAFDVPLAVAVERDAGRARPVGRAVVARQHAAFEASRAALAREGYDGLYLLHDGGVQVTIGGARSRR